MNRTEDVRGVLFQGSSSCSGPEVEKIYGKNCMIGIGYGAANVPIDDVCLFLAGYCSGRYTILLVDEFLRMNKVPEQDVVHGLEMMKNAFDGLSKVYGFTPEIIVASDFMRTEEYEDTVRGLLRCIDDLGMRRYLLETVPERYRNSQNAIEYPLNEIACVDFLRKKMNISVKIGPSKERAYDCAMFPHVQGIEFAYVIDAYALGTSEPQEVVHYIPAHKAGGQRLFLEDCLPKARAKLMLGPENASRYLLKLASAAGYVLGKEHLSPEEIKSLHGKGLKKKCARLVLENILVPYQEVMRHDS